MIEGDKIYCIKKYDLFKLHRYYYITRFYEHINMYVLDDIETKDRHFFYVENKNFENTFCDLKEYRKRKLNIINDNI